MRIQWPLAILLLSLLISDRVFSQHYFFQEFGIRDGLAASKVYTVHEDRSGVIWLGTVNGVSRFDGYQFENFSTNHGLAPDGVKTIYQDSDGTVWLGHYEGGITRYLNGRFEEIVLSGIRSKGDIHDFYEPRPGELWVASNGLGAIHLFNTQSEKGAIEHKQFMGSEGLGDRVFDLAAVKDSSLFFITDVGIKKLESDSTFSFYKPGGMSNMFQLTCMLEDSRGMRWFGTHNGGLYKYAPGNSDIEIIDVLDGLAHNFVFCLHEDNEGNIWAGTYGGGISVINPNGSILTLNSENGLPDEKIQNLTSDRENNILIGTNDKGLLIFKSFQFESFPLPVQYGVQQYNALAHSGEELWIGTEKGLIKADEKFSSHQIFNHEAGLSDPNINAMAFDDYGLLWLGTEFGGVFSFLPSLGKFRGHFYLNQYINQHKVTDLCVGPDNVLWLGTLDGLLAVDESRQDLRRFSQRNGLPSNHISAVQTMPSGEVLAGVVGRGAVRVIGDTAISILTSGTPSCFFEDAQGLVWIGMEGQGVYLMDEGEVKVHLTTDDGLMSNAVATIDQDEDGRIWIGTNLGLSRFDKQTLAIVNYGLSAGFGGVEIKKRASVQTGQDLWYGTANGIYRNQTDREKESYSLGPLHITKVLLNDELVEASGTLDLRFDENELSFSFLTVSLSDPENVEYQTFLEGRDEHWSQWNSMRSITYSGLPEGSYQFHVRAKNRWGEEAVKVAPATFVIHPPWYRSTTFYIIAGISAFVLLVLFIKLRERNLKREKRVLAEKVRQRTREVVEKSEELEKKNNDILDSINYARRIQEAILIPKSVINGYGIDSFIFYKPKDIVSGDFYWFNKIGNKVLFAAADCTGHGVPGAFMSVVGYSLLDKIAIELNETRPEVILQELSLGVEKFLRQKQNDKMPKDGMDMALVVYDQEKNSIDFSGAFNPLYIVRNGEVLEYKADRFSVGSHQSDDDKVFTRHSTEIQPGDCAYVFSDGFVDQFGGPEYKKYKSRNFKAFLTTIAHLPTDEQHQRLKSELEQWMGNREQLDDIVVIGVRF